MLIADSSTGRDTDPKKPAPTIDLVTQEADGFLESVRWGSHHGRWPSRSYPAPHSLRGRARHQEICFGGASRVMMRTLRYRPSEMTFGSRSKFAEVRASFSPPASRDLGIAAPPGHGARQAMSAACLHQITNPARLILGSTVSCSGSHPCQEGLSPRIADCGAFRRHKNCSPVGTSEPFSSSRPTTTSLQIAMPCPATTASIACSSSRKLKSQALSGISSGSIERAVASHRDQVGASGSRFIQSKWING
ncbi:hypothetical protein SAMN05216228_102911 [Rhizobium tibeticum]|uniref:Uncharacterized protein n=1 Tax=Rhizobium tibeticum TaxID=501024 RepID=A0A1H8THZ3_9HYPH|nr:hypothetical protein RTCCBAU85039_5216 [Rhizobium tibeticum]SEO90739.1 hypothetical protein SAMN05216228_102911 [Rhizobium tibeticum]